MVEHPPVGGAWSDGESPWLNRTGGRACGVGRAIRARWWFVRAGVSWWLILPWVLGGNPGRATGAGPTFNRDVAPILFSACVDCHRAGGAGPFALGSYSEVRKRAKEMVESVEAGLMPPWLPDARPPGLVGERRLSSDQIAILKAWVAEGMAEGDAADLPAAPVFSDDWQLGTPEVVVELPQAYPLGAEGHDVYRNFVVPVPAGTNRFVRAFEFQPRNRSVHHARLLFDNSGKGRRLDEADPEVGFGGAMPPGKYPPGHLLGWAPGRRAVVMGDGMSWGLDGRGDLVVQLHLQRTGRPESVRPRIGFYLTNRPPSVRAVLLPLYAETFEVPPGATNQLVTRDIVVPVDADILGVMPHAHYLGRRIELVAEVTNAPARVLFSIGNWRFNWQDVYRYRTPVAVTGGTRLRLNVWFDNSVGNPQNPSRPPRLVRHGPESTDEMAEIAIQVLPREAGGEVKMARVIREYGLRETVAAFTERVGRQPDNPGYRVELAKGLGGLGRSREAFEQLAKAVEAHPDYAEAHHYIGVIYLERRMLAEARAAFEKAVELDPRLARAQVGLAQVLAAMGDLDVALAVCDRALALDPSDEGAIQLREKVRRARDGK